MSESAPRTGRGFAAALACVIGVHAALLLYFAPPSVMFSKQPVVALDYALHVYQVDRASAAFREHRALWAYDPLLLAGQPAGVVEDLTSKGTELFVIALGGLGVPMGLAFNLFIVLVHLGLGVTAFAVGRLLRLERASTLVLYALWVALWFFDSFLHWSWWVGMISWSWASYGSVLLIALLYRTLEEPRPSRFAWLGLLAAGLALVHPFIVLTLAVPCLALYARSFKALARRDHALLWLAAGIAASTALVWIFPLLRFRHYVGDVDTFFNATLSFALFDSLDLLKDGRQTGAPARTLFRTLAFVAGGVLLWRWTKRGDRRALPLGALVLSALVLAYGSAYFWHGRQTQPYRHIGPAMFAAAVPAAILLWEVFSPRALRAYPVAARLAIGLLAVVALPRVVRTVLHYVPDLLPERVLRAKADVLSSALVGLSEPRPVRMMHHGPLPYQTAIRDWLRENHRGRGRVVVADWVLAEYLVVAADVPILGGIVERNVPHVDAHLFRREPDGNLPVPELERYLEDYAVGFVIVFGDFGPLDARRELLEPAEVVGGHRIYRTRREPSYFAAGSGQVTEQAVNRIRVQELSGPAVLRFHYLETLACRPDCSLSKQPIPGDRVGFIRVETSSREIEIYNAY